MVFEWRKRGRPKQVQQEPQEQRSLSSNNEKGQKLSQSDEEKWTRRELTVYRDAVAALVAAVIEQWKSDGRPRDCDIDVWFRLAEDIKKIKGGS